MNTQEQKTKKLRQHFKLILDTCTQLSIPKPECTVSLPTTPEEGSVLINQLVAHATHCKKKLVQILPQYTTIHSLVEDTVKGLTPEQLKKTHLSKIVEKKAPGTIAAFQRYASITYDLLYIMQGGDVSTLKKVPGRAKKKGRARQQLRL